MRKETFDETTDTAKLSALAGAFEAMRFVYIKPIKLEDAKALGFSVTSDIKLPKNVTLYALNAADGTTLGITDNWEAAYGAALENNYVPLSVH